MPLAHLELPRAVYLHVPFCLHHCGYCDFTVVAGRDGLIGKYLEALAAELATLETPRVVNTVFLGGGTPTHLAPQQLEELLQLVHRWFRPAANHYEFSIEANPANLDEARVDVLAAHGVNRISLGVQSFDAEVLAFLERDHRLPEIERAMRLARKHFDNVSFDLIFGVPGQSLALWRKTLRQAIAFRPEHISTYGLTYEKGTRFWTRREKGDLAPAAEELERDMYGAAMDDLQAAGFTHYEISNFARQGRECLHNHVYWAGLAYYAFGPGAARYVNGVRQTNHRSVQTWLNRMLQGGSPIGDEEELDPEGRARELVMLGLRRTTGIDYDEFAGQTGFDLRELAGPTIDRYVASGLLVELENRLRLTREGRFVADSVITDFL